MAIEGLQEPAQNDKPGIIRGAWRFIRNTIKESDFWTRMGGVSNGGVLVAQGVLGAAYLSLPLLLTPLAGVGFCALAVIGLYSVRFGLAGMWKSLENICSKTFPARNSQAIRLWVRARVRKISEKPFMQKLQTHRRHLVERVARLPLIKKIAQNPLAQKFLNSRIAGSRHGLTQRQRDVFMAGISIEGSVATIAFCSIYIAKHMAAAHVTAGGLLSAGTTLAAATPHLIVGGFLATGAVAGLVTAGPLLAVGALATVGMAFATYEVISSTFGLYSYTKTLMRVARESKAAKRSPANQQAPETAATAPPLQEINAPPAFENKTPAFNKNADRQNINPLPQQPGDDIRRAAPCRPQ